MHRIFSLDTVLKVPRGERRINTPLKREIHPNIRKICQKNKQYVRQRSLHTTNIKGGPGANFQRGVYFKDDALE